MGAIDTVITWISIVDPLPSVKHKGYYQGFSHSTDVRPHISVPALMLVGYARRTI
jgi:hypothetical protein